MSRVQKQTSFNLEDAHEKRLYDHAMQYVFSRYVKRLIERDMKQIEPHRSITPVTLQTPIQPQEQLHTAPNKTSAARSFV